MGLRIGKLDRLATAQHLYQLGDADPEHRARLHQVADVLDQRGPALTDVPGRFAEDRQLLIERIVKLVESSS